MQYGPDTIDLEIPLGTISAIFETTLKQILKVKDDFFYECIWLLLQDTIVLEIPLGNIGKIFKTILDGL